MRGEGQWLTPCLTITWRRQRTGRFQITPVWEEMIADLETPISIFKKVASGAYTYLLESVEGGEQLARYSFIGFDPLLVFQARGQQIDIEADGQRTLKTGAPLATAALADG